MRSIPKECFIKHYSSVLNVVLETEWAVQYKLWGKAE